MTIWVIVFYLNAVSGVPILPKERPQGFLLKKECVERIPEMKKRWETIGMMTPQSATCEALEVVIK